MSLFVEKDRHVCRKENMLDWVWKRLELFVMLKNRKMSKGRRTCWGNDTYIV
ncbi:hypothetical protein A0O32_1643 [Anoxybacillus flavithermus]|nr:hypothetical protein A0O32_1643 [Anoxybacillus flavithermus]